MFCLQVDRKTGDASVIGIDTDRHCKGHFYGAADRKTVRGIAMVKQTHGHMGRQTANAK